MADEVYFGDITTIMTRDWRHASRDCPPKISFVNDDQILIASGLRLDTAKYIADCFGHGFPHTESKSWKMVMRAARLAGSFSGGPYWSYWRSHSNPMPPNNEKHLVAVKMKEANGKSL
jgi:hypothetical protein